MEEVHDGSLTAAFIVVAANTALVCLLTPTDYGPEAALPVVYEALDMAEGAFRLARKS